MNLETFWKVLGLAQNIVKPFNDASLGISLARRLHRSTKVESCGVHLSIHSFVQQTFIEHLLGARSCAWVWGGSHVQTRHAWPCHMERIVF